MSKRKSEKSGAEIPDINKINQETGDSPELRRAYRLRRNARNRVAAVAVAAFALILLALGVFVGIRAIGIAIGNMAYEREQAKVDESAMEAAVFADEPFELVEPESFEEETVEYTEEDLLNEVVESCIGEMSLEDKVAGLFIVTPEMITGVGKAVQAGDGTKEALDKYPVGGLIYFAQNIQSADQITEMLSKTKSYSKYPLFLAIDEEVGSVTRLRKALSLDKIETAETIGASGNTQDAYEAYKMIAEYMKGYGFNLDFAPVADVIPESGNDFIGDRSFGSDPQLVSNMVISSISALRDGGVFSCAKHFPGHGGVTADTHTEAGAYDASAEEIRGRDLIPFKGAIDNGVDMIMVGHLAAPALTGDEALPCSLSKEVMTDILRVEYMFQGVIITDALNMSAVSEYYAADEAAVKALKSGADMILMPENFETAYQGVLDAVAKGTISEERINDSLRRIYRLKYREEVVN